MTKLKTIFILFAVFLFACNPSRRIKKIAIKNDLFKQELVILKDTTIIEGASLKMNISPYQFTRLDSVPIFSETERIRVEIQKIRDTFFLKAECLPDTIIKEISIIEEKIIIEEKKGTPLGIISFLLLAIILGYVLIKMWGLVKMWKD